MFLQWPSGCASGWPGPNANTVSAFYNSLQDVAGQTPFANTVSAFTMPLRMCFGLGRPRLPLRAFTQYVKYNVHVHLQRRQCPEMTIVVDWDAKPQLKKYTVSILVSNKYLAGLHGKGDILNPKHSFCLYFIFIFHLLQSLR